MARMSKNIKKIILRMAVLVPLMLGAVLIVKPMTAKAWSWYNPFSWPVWETVDSAITDISDYFVTPDEDLPLNGRLVARVMVEGEDGSMDFYSHDRLELCGGSCSGGQESICPSRGQLDRQRRAYTYAVSLRGRGRYGRGS